MHSRYILIAPLLLLPALSADLPRQVEIAAYTRANAVMITKITVGDIDVQCGLMTGPHDIQPQSPFQAGDDWLQNMTIYLFNRTARPIIRGTVEIGFPELGNGRTSPQPIHSISFGRTPDSVAFDFRTGKPLNQGPRKPFLLLPGQTLAVHVGDYIDLIRPMIEQYSNLSMITKIFIYTSGFFFEDGMQWGGGCYELQKPDRAGVFHCIPDKDFFPGDEHNNWPPPRDGPAVTISEATAAAENRTPLAPDLPQHKPGAAIVIDLPGASLAYLAIGSNAQPLGTRELSAYDIPANGGNGDGAITMADAIWLKLRVWVDANQNGVAEPSELRTLNQAGIQAISLRHASENSSGYLLFYKPEKQRATWREIRLPEEHSAASPQMWGRHFACSRPSGRPVERGRICAERKETEF